MVVGGAGGKVGGLVLVGHVLGATEQLTPAPPRLPLAPLSPPLNPECLQSEPAPPPQRTQANDCPQRGTGSERQV